MKHTSLLSVWVEGDTQYLVVAVDEGGAMGGADTAQHLRYVLGDELVEINHGYRSDLRMAMVSSQNIWTVLISSRSSGEWTPRKVGP